MSSRHETMISQEPGSKARARPGSIPELLAPAGSWDSLVVAVNAGADAVYLSSTQFGARKFAKNFDDEMLSRAIAFSHLRGVNVYVAVNTLLHDEELPEALDLIIRLYLLGANGVLVQDLGLAEAARALVPGLPLHASTQMTLHTAESVAWAAARGFRRVVLARELTSSDVLSIAEDTGAMGIGLEIFIHGALCYSYSGQCLLSSAIGGRSGNRGMCAQPCRKPYELVMGPSDMFGRPSHLEAVPTGGCYLLSTKDIAVYPDLDKVVQLPVESLKIEGRMRTPMYVATVVSVYRNALDRIAKGVWTPSERDIEDLAMAFNRGFTRGYLLGERHRRLMGRERPDNRGLNVGTVVPSSAGSIAIRLNSHVVPEAGDGLVSISRDGLEEGIVLTTSPAPCNGAIRITARSAWKPGAEVFLTRRARLVRQAERLAKLPFPPGFRIPVDISVRLTADNRLELHATANPVHRFPVHVSVIGEPMVPAATAPLSAEQVKQQLSRTGGTIFSIENMEMVYPGGLFSPIGSLNHLRRRLFLTLEQAIIES